VSNAFRSIRSLLGSLIAFPLIAGLWGGAWSAYERVELQSARIGLGDAEPADEAAPFVWLPDGAAPSAGIELAPREFIEAELPRPLSLFSVDLQAEGTGAFRVTARGANGDERLLWTSLPSPDAVGLTTRRSPLLRLADPASSLRITPSVRREPSSISAARVRTPRVSLPLRAAALLPWLVWGIAWAGMRWRPVSSAATRGLAVWRRFDPWIATAAIYAVLFRVEVPGWIGGCAVAGIALGVFALRRAPAVTASIALTVALCAVVFPRALDSLATRVIAERFDLTVDHRLKPDGKNINSDGIRFSGEADDIDPGDFVVAFLGDSFTFGTRLRETEATYPAAFERALNESDCAVRVRSVNFGWPSASPLLSLRQIRQLGRKYAPDLVIYNLDMTDFHDDLRYERALRSAGDFEVDTERVVMQILHGVFPGFDLRAIETSDIDGLLRQREVQVVGAERPLPHDRFFATSQPLADSRPWIEAGVMTHLAAIDDFAHDALGAPMVLVIYPRAYQYSDRESPANWERSAYEVLGPFVREPFRYFAEVAEQLSYPVVSLLPAFEAAGSETLFLSNDPHWNRRGAALAGSTLADALTSGTGERGSLIPCSE